MSWYRDDYGDLYNDYGDIHYVPGGYDPWARIDIASYTFSTNNSGGQLTLTLLHEAVHGYYGDADENRAETTAQRCYR